MSLCSRLLKLDKHLMTAAPAVWRIRANNAVTCRRSLKASEDQSAGPSGAATPASKNKPTSIFWWDSWSSVISGFAQSVPHVLSGNLQHQFYLWKCFCFLLDFNKMLVIQMSALLTLWTKVWRCSCSHNICLQVPLVVTSLAEARVVECLAHQPLTLGFCVLTADD